jgi:NAD(P)-dependent dehydrogenase (short-subunit alcohol dehydrogenase family)
MQIGINHFGHFYLTYKLWDVLTIVPDVRIVNISSYAHTGITRDLDLDFDNLHF